jgi:hypothetical protein
MNNCTDSNRKCTKKAEESMGVWEYGSMGVCGGVMPSAFCFKLYAFSLTPSALRLQLYAFFGFGRLQHKSRFASIIISHFQGILPQQADHGLV